MEIETSMTFLLLSWSSKNEKNWQEMTYSRKEACNKSAQPYLGGPFEDNLAYQYQTYFTYPSKIIPNFV